MKKINGVTICKGIACLMVFYAHYLGTVHTFGFSIPDKLIMNGGPLRILIVGNYAVCIFMVASGFLTSYKRSEQYRPIGYEVIF